MSGYYQRKINSKKVTAPRDYYRPSEVAQRLGLSCEQVLRHLRTKKIPGVKLGRAWLVPAAELQKILTVKDEVGGK